MASCRPSHYSLSGSQSRSIANHAQLAQELSKIYGETRFENVSLERTSIYYQYLMFSRARLIIAQHGGSLSNIFFMKSHAAAVIEISPPYNKKSLYFKNIAHFSEISYYSVDQETDFSDVDIEAILRLAEVAVPP